MDPHWAYYLAYKATIPTKDSQYNIITFYINSDQIEL